MSAERSTRRAFAVVAVAALAIAALVALGVSRWLASVQREREARLATLPSPDLEQWTLDGVPLPPGGTAAGGVLLGARIATAGIAIDVEVTPAGAADSAPVRFHAGASLATGMARIQFAAEPGPYRWRARLLSATATGPWRDFGRTRAADFTLVARVAETPPPEPTMAPEVPPPPPPTPREPPPPPSEDRTDAKDAIGASPAFAGGEGGAWPGPLPSIEHYDPLWLLLAIRLRWIAAILGVVVCGAVVARRWPARRPP